MIYTRVTSNQSPSYTDIVVYEGSSFTKDVTVKSVDGTAFDLTGYSIRGTIKKTEASGSDLNFTTSIINASEGTLRLSLTATQTQSLQPLNKTQTWTVYNVEIYNIAGTVYRILSGQVLIEPSLFEEVASV